MTLGPAAVMAMHNIDDSIRVLPGLLTMPWSKQDLWFHQGYISKNMIIISKTFLKRCTIKSINEICRADRCFY